MTLGNCKQTITEIVENDLCCGCGACVGICPSKAINININFSFKPMVNMRVCKGCGLCYEICPGRGYQINKWVKDRYKKEEKHPPQMGPIQLYLKGHSKDHEIRLNSASGGVATSLLLHLLESKKVDEVMVVGIEQERPIVHLTKDPEIVKKAMMSKYGPVPLLATLIPELLIRPRRIAVTVTPCQLGGWLRAVESIPKLRESTVLTIGLFCGQVQSYNALTSIAAALKIKYPGEAKFIGWRCGPYPGNVRFEKPDGSIFEKPLYEWLDIAVPFFSLNRCLLCPDGGNWLADITLGDIHSGGIDETVIVCRSKTGKEMVESAYQDNKINKTELSTTQVKKCVINAITRSKLLPAIARNAWLIKNNKIAPLFDYNESELFIGNVKWLRLFWILQYNITLWLRTGWRFEILAKHPKLMEKIGHFIYYFPSTIPLFSFMVRKIKSVVKPRKI